MLGLCLVDFDIGNRDPWGILYPFFAGNTGLALL
jgi:hypothetical protein